MSFNILCYCNISIQVFLVNLLFEIIHDWMRNASWQSCYLVQSTSHPNICCYGTSLVGGREDWVILSQSIHRVMLSNLIIFLLLLFYLLVSNRFLTKVITNFKGMNIRSKIIVRLSKYHTLLGSLLYVCKTRPT